MKQVRVCERVDAGFLTTVEFMRRKVTWNVEDFFWIDEPIHTLALAEEFHFVGEKQLDKFFLNNFSFSKKYKYFVKKFFPEKTQKILKKKKNFSFF